MLIKKKKGCYLRTASILNFAASAEHKMKKCSTF